MRAASWFCRAVNDRPQWLSGSRRQIAIFLLALIARAGAICLGGPDHGTFGDAPDYLATASRLCQDHEYPDRGNLPFFRAPLLPFFIAATTWCHPERAVVVKAALAVCDSGTVLVIGEIAWLLMGSTAVAIVAAVLAALNPFFILGVVDVRTEPLFMFFLTLAVWGLLNTVRSGRGWGALLSGAAFALASLTRPAGLAALVLGGVTLALCRGPGTGRRLQVLAFVAGAGVFLLPWVVRNAIRYRELIVVNDAAGFSFWRGSHPEMLRIARIKDRSEYRRAAAAFETDVTNAVEASILVQARSPNERSRAWFAAGLENIRGNPGDAAAFAVRRAWDYWRPWLNPQEHGMKAVLGSAVFNLSLFSLAALGLRQFRPRNEFVFAWITVFFAAMWLAHIPHQVVMRFRIPSTDPLLVVFAASAIVRIARRVGGGVPTEPARDVRPAIFSRPRCPPSLPPAPKSSPRAPTPSGASWARF